MAVHTQESHLKVLAMIFEARYDEGYRFLDHSGEWLVRTKKESPEWTVVAVGQQLISLVHYKHHLRLNVGINKLDLSTTKLVPFTEAERQVESLGRSAEEFYGRTLDVIKIPRTTRIGVRFGFMAPSDSLEEADRFFLKACSSPLLDMVAKVTNNEPIDAQMLYVVDDPGSGYRRRVSLSSAIVEQRPEDPPYLGLPGDVGSGGVVVDIDTYTRPADTHLAKVNLFVQDGYTRSRTQAAAIFAWLLGQHK